MKRFLLLSLLAVSLRAATINVILTYTFTGTVPCSATVTTNCLSKFEAGTYIGGTFVSLTNIPLPTNPTGTGTMTGSFTLNGVYGAIPIAAVVVANDMNGASITSNPSLATASASVLPGPPTLTVSVGP